MAAQATLKLIDRRIHRGHTIGGVYASNAVLRSTSDGRGRECDDLVRSMTVVAVRASRVPIIV